IVAPTPMATTRPNTRVASVADSSPNPNSTFSNSLWNSPPTSPVAASENNNVGTTAAAGYPSTNNNAPRVAPKPIPDAESNVSKRNAAITIVGRNVAVVSTAVPEYRGTTKVTMPASITA